MMHHIRPYKVLSLVQGDLNSRTIKIPIPCRKGTQSGSPTVLELSLILALAKITVPHRIFEIGTCHGATTLIFAMNTNAQVLTLDLDIAGSMTAVGEGQDADFIAQHLAEERMDFEGTEFESYITALKGDSTRFDFRPYEGTVNMVLVDGGHDYETVKSDSSAAFRLLDRERPGAVFWHDYRSHAHAGVTYFLDKESESLELFHIEDTNLCLWVSDPEIGDKLR